MNQHKDVVRRAAKFRVDRYSSLVDSLLEIPFDKLTAMSLSNGSARLYYELCKLPGTVLLHLIKKGDPRGA